MFPRIKKSDKQSGTYEYLVISESVHVRGRGSTTKDIAVLGNVKKYTEKDISNLIDGLIRIFQIEKYSLTKETEMLESLEHGSIIFWQKIWNELGLTKAIKKYVCRKSRRLELEVEKYIEMMTVNRCMEPKSKLGCSRWVERTSYKEMSGYKGIGLGVNNFYRSMDELVKIKEELEGEIYEKLRNLFSVDVRMTFYDITSTYFYTGKCPLVANGYSRDMRPDKEQIIIGVVTSYEGYPIKHYVFQGNTKDETTVEEVVEELKKKYKIEDTTFVGDRGMITKLNLDKIKVEGYDYIMGVKIRQDEICKMLFDQKEEKEYDQQYRGLKMRERKVEIKEFLIWKIGKILEEEGLRVIERQKELLEEKIRSLRKEEEIAVGEITKLLKETAPEIEKKELEKIKRLVKKYEGRYEEELRYVICLNEERKKESCEKRHEKITQLEKEFKKVFEQKNEEREIEETERLLNKIFEGYKARYRKYFEIKREKKSRRAIGYKLNEEEIKRQDEMDGIFALLTTRQDIKMSKVVESYKNLQEIEILFDDFKNFVDVHPVRHWLEVRVRAHVFICILSLLLKRVFEINYMRGKAVMEALEEISKLKLIRYKIKYSEKDDRCRIVSKVTTPTTNQKKYFNMIGLKQPMSLEKFNMVEKEKR